MHRTFVTLAALLLTMVATISSGFAAAPSSLRFSIERGRDAGTVQLSMRENSRGHDSNWSSSIALGELRGLDPARLGAGGMAPVSFTLVREAGRFECRGAGGRSGARGDCTFTPDPAFGAFLASRGIGQPSRNQAYALAISSVGRAHVLALAANRYPRPTVDQLVAMGIHGASPRFIDELATAGYRLRSVDDLVTFRIHGVDAGFIRAIGAASPGFRNVSADDLVTFKIHGVSPELVRTYSRLGTQGIDRKSVVAMSIHGVTPRYIEDLARLGYRDLSSEDLVQMRIFGVTPEFVRSHQQRGGRPSIAQLVAMRIHGR
jgi:hypothetical protein